MKVCCTSICHESWQWVVFKFGWSVTNSWSVLRNVTKDLEFGLIYFHKTHFFPEDGVGLVPKRGYLFTLAFSRWYKFRERRWSDILIGENRSTRRKIWPSATLSTTNPTWIDPGANPGLRGERPSTNDLRHGMAFHKIRSQIRFENPTSQPPI
jgi:hypothetical protein